jgi:hypothetical protein
VLSAGKLLFAPETELSAANCDSLPKLSAAKL